MVELAGYGRIRNLWWEYNLPVVNEHKPLSVIACLSSGLELVGRHLSLIFWPVLLDLWLWLGPRLSIADLLHRLVTLLTSQPAPNPEVASQTAQAVQMLEQAGERFNLFSLLSTMPLLNVPTLLARRSFFPVTPLGEPTVWNVGSTWAFLGWVVLLLALGSMLGVLYLDGVSQRLRPPDADAGDEDEDEVDMFLIAAVFHLLRVLRVVLFVAGLLTLGALLLPPWSLLVGLLVALSPMLGLLLWAVSLWIVGYVLLHLLFVIPALLLDDLTIFPAVRTSILLVRFQFPAVVGLIVLIMLVYEGLGLIWSLPPGDSWTQLIGILGNGSIATGLTAALFIFYRERWPVVAELIQKASQE